MIAGAIFIPDNLKQNLVKIKKIVGGILSFNLDLKVMYKNIYNLHPLFIIIRMEVLLLLSTSQLDLFVYFDTLNS